MGFFKHLPFIGGKSIAAEREADKQKRLVLWEEHKANYANRESLAKFFNFVNVDKALSDFSGLLDVLSQMERLISRDMVDIDGEERTNEEIMADLLRLTSRESRAETELWHKALQKESDRYNIVMAVLRKLHDLLKLELHTIRLIRARPGNVKDLLLLLFRLVFHQEAYLMNSLSRQADESLAEEVNKIVRAVLLEEEYKRVEKADAGVRAKVKRRVKREPAEADYPVQFDPASIAAYERRKQVERERRLRHILVELNAIFQAEFPEEAQHFEIRYAQINQYYFSLFGRTATVSPSQEPAFAFFLVPKSNPGNMYEIMHLFRQDVDAKVRVSEIRAFYQLVHFRENMKKGILHFSPEPNT